MSKMKIATTIGEFYDFVPTPADAVRAYEGTGFCYLDYSFYRMYRRGCPFLEDSWKQEVTDAGNAAAGLGFSFVQAHAPAYNPMGDELTDHEAGMLSYHRAIEACGMLGIHNMVIHTGITPRFPYPEGMDGYMAESKAFLEKLIPELERYNVCLCMENSAEANMRGADGKVRYFPMTAIDLNTMIDYIGHPLVKACWDVGHGHMRGTDPYEEITGLGKNLAAIHIHDNHGVRDEHLALFDGTIDVDAILRGLRGIAFPGPFTLESDSFFRAKRREAKEFDLLAAPPLAAKRAAVRMMYETANACLNAYGL